MKNPKLQAKILKERDLELHIRTASVLGADFIELRDYVPSTKTYSRGMVIRKHQLAQLIEELQGLEQHLSWGRPKGAEEVEGQLSLGGVG